LSRTKNSQFFKKVLYLGAFDLSIVPFS